MFVLEYGDRSQVAMAGMDTARAEMGRADTARADMAGMAGMAHGSNMDQGQILVEMDDGDRDADAYVLAPGDTVTVHGWIDDGLFETRTIEASAVHVQNVGTWFYASGIDEKDTVVTIVHPVLSQVIVRGIVTSVSDEEFTLASGVREITVGVEDLPSNPLGDDSYQQIEVGDEVTVMGQIEYDFLEGREIMASSVSTLRR